MIAGVALLTVIFHKTSSLGCFAHQSLNLSLNSGSLVFINSVKFLIFHQKILSFVIFNQPLLYASKQNKLLVYASKNPARITPPQVSLCIFYVCVILPLKRRVCV